MNAGLPFAAACERNKQPIFEVLKQLLPPGGHVLEIGSCTGQHLVFFADRLPGLIWQPSDCLEHLEGLAARIRQEGSPNILPVIELDVFGPWPDRAFDAVYSSNTAHIMSWEAVCAMFAGVADVLCSSGTFLLYGPFNESGRFTAPSNEAFDRDLRGRDPVMGLRDIAVLDSLSQDHQMALADRFQMPANNQLLVFRKSGGLKDG